MRFAQKSFPTEYIPTIMDITKTGLVIDNQTVTFEAWDTHGSHDYERLRPIVTHPNTDVFLVCFTICRYSSFQDVKSFWLPNIAKHCPKTPFLIVGTKRDLRHNIEKGSELRQHSLATTLDEVERLYARSNQVERMVNVEEALELADEVNAEGYLECSALTGEGVEELFQKAARVAMRTKEKEVDKTLKPCKLL